MAKPIITKELQETVRTHKNIDTIYFDAKGNHHFQAFTDKKTGKLFIKNGALITLLEPMSREDLLAVKATLKESPNKVAPNGAQVGRLGSVSTEEEIAEEATK